MLCSSESNRQGSLLDDAGDDVVVVGLGDLGAVEGAGDEGFVEADQAVGYSRRMAGTGPRSGSRSARRLLLAFLCIVLVVFLGTVQAAHSHADRTYHADCALCASAHVAVQAAAPPVVLQITHVESQVESLILPVRHGKTLTFALFTRPPPVNAIFA